MIVDSEAPSGRFTGNSMNLAPFLLKSDFPFFPVGSFATLESLSVPKTSPMALLSKSYIWCKSTFSPSTQVSLVASFITFMFQALGAKREPHGISPAPIAFCTASTLSVALMLPSSATTAAWEKPSATFTSLKLAKTVLKLVLAAFKSAMVKLAPSFMPV